jgi:glucose-fructose oxidoreductase
MLKRHTASPHLGRVSRTKGQSTGRVRRSRNRSGKVRYAVVGLGHIAQAAVLPAFAHASKNSELVALFSDDVVKLRELSKRYGVAITGTYDEYTKFLRSGSIDAVYIAEPNSLHREFTVAAAEAGVHVLCEKPLAVTKRDCEQMIQACRRHGVKLMTAYRLHFEKANLEAVKEVQSGGLGEPRFFNSIFSMQVKPGNIRVQKKLGGGPLLDLGIYCINAARYLFRAEPTEVQAITVRGSDRRFREVEEAVGVVMRFPGERLATFICSFGAADSGEFQVVGTEGSVHLKNAYEYVMPIEMEVKIGEKSQKRVFPKRDQFAPELIYFSDCILRGKEPEPSGAEGLNDVGIIQAIFKSAKDGKRVRLTGMKKRRTRPGMRQQIRRRPVKEEPELVRAEAGSQD